MTAPSGLLVIDKPGGITSHGVVSVVRRALDTRKVGHAGTLDPMATGVLLIGVGRATRLLGHLALRDKGYAATMRLGASTVTDDHEGSTVRRAAAEAVDAVDDASIRSAVATFLGAIEQVPSSVSAIKVDGKRAHRLVREGSEVDLKARRVTVGRFDIGAIRRTESGFIDVDVEVECSTGTYVRALARDLGDRLGVGGHLTALRRTRIGGFTLADAVPLDALEVDPLASLIALADVARRSFPSVQMDELAVADLRHGRRVPWPGAPDAPDAVDGTIAMLDASGELVALAERRADRARTLVVFTE